MLDQIIQVLNMKGLRLDKDQKIWCTDLIPINFFTKINSVETQKETGLKGRKTYLK